LPHSGFSVILVPTDGLDPPRAALELARSLARRGARLIVAHVGCEPAAPGLETPPFGCGGDDPTVRVEIVSRAGPPAEAIVGLADELGCELIVIGDDTRSRLGVERLLTGSVAQDVLRHAVCPVLCLPGPTPHTGPFATASTTGAAAFLPVD
jgi:nucleotide-binding universal stress UspA family protein